MRRGLLILLVVLLTTGGLQARDTRLWGALLLATNEKPEAQVPSELARCEKPLTKIFGYPYFRVLGQSSRRFKDSGEQWLIPGGSFSVRAVIKPDDDANQRVSLQLFQAKKELVDTEAKMGPGSPLFIRGPLYGEGQLIIVIMVR